MRIYTTTITSNTQIRADLHVLEMYAPQLAQGCQPGQYCMLRCCDALASDPLLRRPFFVHSIQRDRGLCRLLVRKRGRGTSWLCKQPVGATLDALGPLGRGWTIRPTVRNMLLAAEGELVVALMLLAQAAIEQEVAVTLLAQFPNEDATIPTASPKEDAPASFGGRNMDATIPTASPKEDAPASFGGRNMDAVYPPALLPAEVEYHIVTGGASSEQGGDLVSELNAYLGWADAACCAVGRETARALYARYERLRAKHFAQGILVRPLVCGSGACLTCSVDTYSGPKLVCKDGPVFDLRELARH